MELFPVEVNRAPYELLLRVPGIGVTSAKRILKARRVCSLDFAGLKKLGVVLKRAQYFLTCKGRAAEGVSITPDAVLRTLISERCQQLLPREHEQLSLFTTAITREDVTQCLTGQL